MSHHAEDAVEITVPGHPTLVRVLRSLAGRTADLAGLGFDRVEDLGLAVDEAAAALLAVVPGPISTSFEHTAGSVDFVMSATGDPAPWPPSGWDGSIGSMVLESVADSVGFEQRPGFAAIRVRVSAH